MAVKQGPLTAEQAATMRELAHKALDGCVACREDRGRLGRDEKEVEEEERSRGAGFL